jgi:hypothetical protein
MMPIVEPSVIETLRTLEEQLNSAEIRRERKTLEDLISDEFREIGSSGVSYDKQQTIDALLASEPEEITMTDFIVKELSATVFLVSYHALKKGSSSLRSSIWILNDDCWKIMFHQGTMLPITAA